MHPILLQLGPLTFYSYGAMLVLGACVATGLACGAARRLPMEFVAITPDQLIDFACVALLGGIVGGRLLYVLLEFDEFAQRPSEIIALWHGGLVWYGGFLGGVLAGWGYVRAKRLEFLRVLDQFIPFVALGHGIGRLGCFLNGCCYGTPSQAWCAVRFPGLGGRRWPTQLFEAAGLVCLYLVLRRLQRPRHLSRTGWILGWCLILYATLRFFLERLRGDQSVWWAGLTLAQVVSVAVAILGAWLLWSAARGGQAMRTPSRREAPVHPNASE